MTAAEIELTEEEVAALDGEPHRETIAEIAERESEPEITTDETDDLKGERQSVPDRPIVDEQKRDKALTGEATRHENALKKIYGDDFEHRAFCPLCIGEGFLEPIPAGGQPEEIWEAVKALSGRLDSGEYQTPPEFVVCARCQGIGQVSTGARNEHNSVIPCELCASRGYFNDTDPIHRAKLGLKPPETPQPAAWAPTLVIPGPVAVQEPAAPQGWFDGPKIGGDSWGRWPGHPRFGIDPATSQGVW